MVDCVDTWSGFETAVGWVREMTCGITQVVTGVTGNEYVTLTAGTGTSITATKDSRAVSGVGTDFDTAQGTVGGKIRIGSRWYEIASLDSGTALTLRYPFEEETTTELTFDFETSQYDIDETLGLSLTVQRFNRFGIITSFSPEHNTNMIRKRGVGSSIISKQVHGAYETTMSLTYNPENLDRMRFVLGKDGSTHWLRQCKVSVSQIDETKTVTLSPPASDLYYTGGSYTKDYEMIVINVTTPLAKVVASTAHWSITGSGATFTWLAGGGDDQDIEIYYTAEYDINTLTRADHVESFSVMRALRRYVNGYATAKDVRELYNACRIDTWSMEIGTDDMVTFNEDIISRYVRLSGESTSTEITRRTFPAVSGVDSNSIFYSQYGSSIVVGDVPSGVDQNCDFYEFHDMKLQFVHKVTEDIDTSTTTGDFIDDPSSARRILYLSHAPYDMNQDGKINTDDIVWVIKTSTSGSLPTICHISGSYLFFPTAMATGITAVTVTYYYIEDTYNFSSFSLEIAKNLKQNLGIYDTIPVPYEIADGAFDVSGSFDANVHDYSLIKYYLNSTEFQLVVSFGTDYKMIVKHATFDGALPDTPEEDLYTVGHDFVASDVEVWDWFDETRNEYAGVIN